MLLLLFKDCIASRSSNGVVVSADSCHKSVFKDRLILRTRYIITLSLQLVVWLHLRGKNAHCPVIMHLGHHCLIHACILLKTGLVVLIDPSHIGQHLSVNVLSARDLVVVQL